MRCRRACPVFSLVPDATASRTLSRMDAEPTDEALMMAYGRGDVGAFETLYGKHRGGLFRFLLRSLRQQALAEECFQDVWSRVIAARERYRPEARFTTWLYQIASNRLTDHWRAMGRQGGFVENGDERAEREPDPSTPDHELSEFEQRRRLQMALEELPPEQREAVLLRLEQELGLEEIAQITGVGRETVKSRLRYAMDKLRTRLGS
jgi:RNA polymerase sigma-70 factor (ECF subfamily)